VKAACVFHSSNLSLCSLCRCITVISDGKITNAVEDHVCAYTL